MMSQYTNLAYLKEISSGDRKMILEMIDIFTIEVPGYLSRMNEFMKKKDWDALGKLVHKAKASASIMGIQQLTDELKNLELLLKENKGNKLYTSSVRSIEKQFKQATEELKMISKTL